MVNLHRSKVIFGISLLCIAMLWIIYTKRFVISAMISHWGHGNSVSISHYIISVPRSWRIVTHENDRVVMSSVEGNGTISVDHGIHNYLSSLANLDNWASLTRQSFQRNGVEPSNRSFQIGDEHGICLSGTAFLAPGKGMPPIVSGNESIVRSDCAFVGSLTVSFVGRRSALPVFYSFVGTIAQH